MCKKSKSPPFLYYKEFDESSDSGEFVDFGERSDSGESVDPGESGESGDFVESGDSGDQRISASTASAATVHQQKHCIISISASAASSHQQHQLHALEGISAHIHQSIQVISAYIH